MGYLFTDHLLHFNKTQMIIGLGLTIWSSFHNFLTAYQAPSWSDRSSKFCRKSNSAKEGKKILPSKKLNFRSLTKAQLNSHNSMVIIITRNAWFQPSYLTCLSPWSVAIRASYTGRYTEILMSKSYTSSHKAILTNFHSSSGLRVDGRRPNELRKIIAKTSVLAQADGSAYIEQGNTKVLAAVYGPQEVCSNIG